MKKFALFPFWNARVKLPWLLPHVNVHFTSSRFLYCRSPRALPDGGKMNIYSEHLWSGLYRKGSRKFTILPQKLTTYKLTNLQYGRSCWSCGVEQLRVDSMDVFRAHEPRIFTREKHILPSTSNFEQLESLSESSICFSSYLLWKLLPRTDLGRTVINNPNLFRLVI